MGKFWNMNGDSFLKLPPDALKAPVYTEHLNTPLGPLFIEPSRVNFIPCVPGRFDPAAKRVRNCLFSAGLVKRRGQ